MFRHEIHPDIRPIIEPQEWFYDAAASTLEFLLRRQSEQFNGQTVVDIGEPVMQDPGIISTTHRSNQDSAVLGVVDPNWIRFLAKDEMWHTIEAKFTDSEGVAKVGKTALWAIRKADSAIGMIPELGGSFPAGRDDNFNWPELIAITGIGLANGNHIGAYWEGKRIKPYDKKADKHYDITKVQRLKRGPGMLAVVHDVPLQTGAIWGSHYAKVKNVLHKKPIVVNMGEPVRVSEVIGREVDPTNDRDVLRASGQFNREMKPILQALLDKAIKVFGEEANA